ncbi:hypothetical protein PUNSTDRAFT_44642 [Punctularia strigosozonata HHB-11173 SS5]|uniref:uncharacterized protein n=1 Tax=Punctularia strigosozonata (strain HHB-11173) TaxID=741275 RepID=UPI0004417ACD|nr:uncharacterized protein PUNSTDRAFT_44642 [Punctularia strigosozonata HHB-11173 SS5]EIN09247.1 hypothetical protein PUNSTDRAFT_44642 [Punctularia strigosozonata HHB-11173 SS5]
MMQTLEIIGPETGRSPKRVHPDDDHPKDDTNPGSDRHLSGDVRDEVIDEIESRPRIPLPQRAIWPSPTAPPAFTKDNPHTQSSRRGEAPLAKPTDQSVEFLDATFPRIGLSMVDLLDGMEMAQTTPVLNNPGEFLAIVPFNAGPDLFAACPTLHTDIRDFIADLRIDEGPPQETLGSAKRRLDTHRPLAKRNSKRTFDKPWTILLTGFNNKERTYLLFQQTFAVNEDICFHVLSFDPTFYEWTIMHISGDAVRAAEDEEARKEVEDEILTTIKTTLWKDKPFRNFVDQTLRAAGIPGTVNDRVAYATSSFTLSGTEEAPYLEEGNRMCPLQIVHSPGMGLPVPEDPGMHVLFGENETTETLYGPNILSRKVTGKPSERINSRVWAKSRETEPKQATNTNEKNTAPNWLGGQMWRGSSFQAVNTTMSNEKDSNGGSALRDGLDVAASRAVEDEARGIRGGQVQPDGGEAVAGEIHTTVTDAQRDDPPQLTEGPSDRESMAASEQGRPETQTVSRPQQTAGGPPLQRRGRRIAEQVPHTRPVHTEAVANELRRRLGKNPNNGRAMGKPRWKPPKAMKAGIHIASLNIRGFGQANSQVSHNKWLHINQLMRERRIAILLVQEAHMDDQRRDEIETLFTNRLRVFVSPDPDNPTGKAGVAIVVNKQLIRNWDKITAKTILPGRALGIELNMLNNKKLTVLNVYAPNDPQENLAFWIELDGHYAMNRRETRPNVMGGDFNLVESDIDRLPSHPDLDKAVEKLDETASRLRLIDGWRNTYVDRKEFTYYQKSTMISILIAYSFRHSHLVEQGDAATRIFATVCMTGIDLGTVIRM